MGWEEEWHGRKGRRDGMEGMRGEKEREKKMYEIAKGKQGSETSVENGIKKNYKKSLLIQVFSFTIFIINQHSKSKRIGLRY